MIGREVELAILQQTNSAVEARGSGKFITVIGEAGIGKSRLLAEFERWLTVQAGEIEL